MRTVVDGLVDPWDVQPLGGGRLLVTERDRARLSVVRKGHRRTVRFPSDKVWVSGETGLMSLAVDPAFERTRRFWTCQGWQTGDGHDVRVSLWRLSDDARRASLVRHVVTGLPSDERAPRRAAACCSTPAPGRCTSAPATPPTPPTRVTSPRSAARSCGCSGGPAGRCRTTRTPTRADRRQRLVLTSGHRNVQGLAQRPSDGSVVSVEHGSYRDDEVNALSPGADFGWNPGPGYDESVPMTDQALPGKQTEAIWSSGDPTIATSGAAWVEGRDWGAYAGTLAVAALKGEEVLFLGFDDDLVLQRTWTPQALQRFGRLRSVTRLAAGDLLVTTSNGADDRVLRVSPR